MIKPMGPDYWSTAMATTTKVNSWTTLPTGRVNLSIPTGLTMKVIGKTTANMDLVKKSGKITVVMKESIKMVCGMAMDTGAGPMAVNTKAALRQE